MLLYGFIYLLLNPHLVKKKFVVLFTNRFGHFIQNTEVFMLEGVEGCIDDYVFILMPYVETSELLALWKRKIKYTVPYSVGYFLIKTKVKNVIDISASTLPQSEKKYLNNKSVFNELIDPNGVVFNTLKNRYQIDKFVTFSVRESDYGFTNSRGVDAPYRDTHSINLQMSLDYLNANGYKIIRVNKSRISVDVDVDFIFDYGICDNYKLEEALTFIKHAQFHIGTSTGIDIYPTMAGVPTLQTNAFLGLSFILRAYKKRGIYLPMKIFSTRLNRYCTLEEEINFLKISQYLKHDHILPEDQKKFGCVYVNNSEKEILDAVKEIECISRENFKLTADDICKQNAFWKKYPSTWKNDVKSDVAIIDIIGNGFNHKGLISPSFLRSHYDYL